MEKLMQVLMEAVSEAQSLVSEYKSKLAHLEGREASHNFRLNEHDARVADVSAREAKITPVENIAVLQKTLEKKETQISEERSAFEQKKQEFKTHSDQVDQQLKVRASDLDAIQKNLDLQAKKIEETINRRVKEFTDKFKQ